MLERQNQQIENIEYTSNQEETQNNLDSIYKQMQSGNISEIQKEKAIDYILSLAQIEEKYTIQKTEIKQEIRKFIKDSFGNQLGEPLGEYNISQFDKDKNNVIDSKEEKDYSQNFQTAIQQIILLGGFERFTKIHQESFSKTGFFNGDKWLAKKADLGNYVFGEKSEKKFAETTLQKLGEISEAELYKMQEKKFQATNAESWKELGLLLAKEFGDGVEDVLRFLTNIPSGIILLPRYLKYRVDKNSSDEKVTTEAEIKIQELTQENSSLVLLDLLGEQGVELLKKLGEMLVSGKQGDIAMMMVTIAGFIAGGAGATRLGINLARKSSLKTARAAGRESRISGEVISASTRNTMKGISQKVGKIGEVAARVDDVVGGAGIGHLTGSYSNKKYEKGNINNELYNSHFSKNIPENLQSQNPMAWIDIAGRIHYNHTFIENKFGVKITNENGKNLFDGKTLKQHKRASEILDFLKELKAHEVTHRILELKGIQELTVGEKIYSQEDICSIVDGSRKLLKAELEALEKALKEKLGDDFRLLKSGDLDADFLRRYDTKILQKGGDFRRIKESARSGNIVYHDIQPREGFVQIERNSTIRFGAEAEYKDIDLFDVSGKGYYILKEPWGGKRWEIPYGETINIGRGPDNFISFSEENRVVSRQHASIHVDREGNIFLKDLGSTNGTSIYQKPATWVKEVPIEVGQTIPEFKNNESSSSQSTSGGGNNISRGIGKISEAFKKNISSSEKAQKMLNDPKVPQAVYRVIIDGREFLLTDKVAGSRDTIIGYTEINGKIEARFFYFSISGGNWHCAPFIEPEGRFSKGELWNNGGYAKGTVVSRDFQKILSDIPYKQGFDDLTEVRGNNVGKMYYTEEKQFDSFKNRKTYQIGDNNWSDVKGWDEIHYMNIGKHFDLQFSGGFRKGDRMHHTFLGEVDTTIGVTSFNGKQVEVIFAQAKDNPSLVWIEDILIIGSKIDSFGIPNDIVNGGLLTTKPVDHKSQLPEFLRGDERLKYYTSSTGLDYVDIRVFLQENPLIRTFKKMHGIN